MEEEEQRKSTLGVIAERLRQMNDRLSNVQKMAIAGLVGALLIAIVLIAWFANTVEMATLYSGLDEQQSGRLVEELKSRGVQYEVAAGGTVIQVPSDQIYELRMTLASSGIGGGSTIGYELIDQNEMFGMPEDVIEVNKRRILEGELARSIASMEEIKTARVHLALPEESLFVEETRPATASVVLALMGGAELNKFQVQGIVNLVAGAVTGLSTEQVTVVDQRGKVLNKPHGDSVDGTSSLEYQRTVERELEKKATEVLERFIGDGKSVVRVRALMDFSREERTEELYDPERQVIRSEESLNEVRENGGNRVGGGAGADQNDPNIAQGVVRVGDASNANREKVITNYEINKVTKRVRGQSANLRRLSVAVIVDGNYKDGAVPEGTELAEGASPPQEYIARTEEEMETIRKLVANAVEFDPRRGDQIEVANVQFQEEDLSKAEAALAASERKAAVRFWTRMGLVLAMGLLLVFLVFRPMVRSLTEQPDVAEVLDGGLPGEEGGALPGEELFDESDYEEVPVSEKLVAFCKSNPQTAADVMSYWLKQEA